MIVKRTKILEFFGSLVFVPSSAFSSFLKTADSQMLLFDIPLEDLQKIMLQAGNRKIIACKTTQVNSQFLPLQWYLDLKYMYSQ